MTASSQSAGPACTPEAPKVISRSAARKAISAVWKDRCCSLALPAMRSSNRTPRIALTPMIIRASRMIRDTASTIPC
jgi:hypothetical protein